MDYIFTGEMLQPGIWGTDIEIEKVSKLLNCNIATWSKYGKTLEWQVRP